VLDWRQSSLDAAGQASAGFLPGIVGEVFTARGGWDVTTWSLRHARARPLGRRLSLVGAVGVHYTRCDLDWRVTRIRSIGSDPEPVSEYSLDKGILRLLSLTLGLRLDGDHFRGVLAMTAGYGTASGPERITVPPPSPPSEDSRQLRPRPIWNSSVVWEF
jgi:hypothetical protein